MSRLFSLASRGTAKEFFERYGAEDARLAESTGRTLLMAALRNDDPSARVAIAHRLLDDGADAAATVSESGVNALHVLLGAFEHDFEAEAPLVARLLEAGASANAVAARFGTPVVVALDEFIAANPAAAPVLDALAQHGAIDFDVHVQRSGAPVTTLRERVLQGTKPGNPLRTAAEA